MKDIFDKLKDAGRDALGTFVEFDPEAPQAAPQRAPAHAAPADVTLAAAPRPAPAAPVAAGSAAPDPEFVQQLQAAVGASGKAAYGQFRTLFGALSAVPDDTQRATLALAAAQASHGVTAQQVAEAIDDRLRILAGERTAFQKAVGDETEATIGGAQKEIDAARTAIAKKAEEIRELQARQAELEASLAQARASIDGNSARFDASYAVVEAELAAERARIAPLIPPAAGAR
ncbi:hypothetical protein [Longimicrobium terrae]|uniref:Uncharacterized protein n=1 Tax=Longimicrobium terrae TaxID=1639882 RepID=A0A841GYA1_9BACT|nr:hypothetical protein [Longimicrobium terrae]MBB4636327.1 hypothetical protein [Longimicrobium terrae]MBB6070723.1 hypothetical protein [Longimicrobium terrae]NNC29703.1 hypothetical protein [Longimicrobium terrae]